MKIPARPKKMAGFSLVEVAMSLLIASFALVAILGLVSVSQRSTKDSSDDTRLSQIARQVFQQVQIDLATNAAFTMNPAPAQWSSVTVNGKTQYQRQYWFDDQGVQLTTQPNPGVFCYTVTVNLGDLATYPPNVDDTILKGLVITILWPPGAAASPATTRTYSMLLRNRGSYGNSSIYTPP